MSINKFNAKNGVSVGNPAISVIDNSGNATFLSLAISGAVDCNGTGAIKVPVGTEIERPTASQGMIRYNTSADSFEGYNGTVWGNIGNDVYTRLDSDATLKNSDKILADTVSGAFNLTLPSGVEGNTVEIWDYSGSWETNHLTVIPASGEKINNLAESMVLDLNDVRVTFVYTDANKGWQFDVGGINGWSIIGGGGTGGSAAVSGSNDTTSNITVYPMLSTATSGTITEFKVADSKLSFNPSTGILTSNFAGNLTGNATYSSQSASAYNSDNLGGNSASYFAPQSALSSKADLNSPLFTGSVSGITASMVGLGNVNNTSDANKPVSSATQTALNLKADLTSPSLSGTPTAPTAEVGTSNTQIATTGFVHNQINSDISNKADIYSPLFTGSVSADNLKVTGTLTASAANLTNFPTLNQNTTGTASSATYASQSASAYDSDKLGGQLPSYYATSASVSGNQTIVLSGGVSGSGTTSINVTVLDNSHNHDHVDGNFTVGGNLVVNGITTTVNSTETTLIDPIISLGGSGEPVPVDDNKDRGVRFYWNAGGTDANTRAGFFGFDDSTSRFTFVPHCEITNEVVSGALGDIEAANFYGDLIGTASYSSQSASAYDSDNLGGNSASYYAPINNPLFTGTVSASSITSSSIGSYGTNSANPERGNWNPLYTAISAGKSLFTDEEFIIGSNTVSAFNTGTRTITITREAASASTPNGSGYRLAITHSASGTSSLGIGGIQQVWNSRANITIAQRFRAKIPVGYTINLAENSQGANSNSYWLTSQQGTGKWEDYIRVTQCGNTGTFSTGGMLYLTGTAASITWYLASCNAYEVDTPSNNLGIVLSDTVLANTKYRLVVQNGELGLLQVSDDAISQTNIIKDSSTGVNYSLTVASGKLTLVEL